MIRHGRRASVFLFLGDLASFAVALYLTLFVRYGRAPSTETLAPYFVPFALLFALWLLVFYGAGLYGKRLALFPSRVPDALLKTQGANILFAAVFFFFVPAFGIAPKTILVLYLIISLAVVFFWRLGLYPYAFAKPRAWQALLIAAGSEADALTEEVNGNARYGLRVARPETGAAVDSAAALHATMERHGASLVIVDERASSERVMDAVYALTRAKRAYQFVSFADLYEEVFDRVALSQLSHRWFLDHVTASDPLFYAVAKRVLDLFGACLMGIVTLVIAPFVFVANHLEGSGPLFIRQERFGKLGKLVVAYKFRSMRVNKSGSSEWTTEEKRDNPITRVGSFLRRTSLDEFPQFLNIFAGELSLIGPRNDILGLGARLAEALPYYEARYLVTPGITGWAQINQQYEPGNVSPQSVEETKVRLAYDFYYLKHRSLGLDIVIALKTVKRMFFRVSSW